MAEPVAAVLFAVIVVGFVVALRAPGRRARGAGTTANLSGGLARQVADD
jgi:hypothetical protein